MSVELVHVPTYRVRLLLNRPPGTLLVHEIYRSIQGESTFVGLPCVFVRLIGSQGYQLEPGECATESKPA